jgi:hypothetical protein
MITQDAPMWIEKALTHYQRPATDIAALDAVVAKIHSFEVLPRGWYCGQGEPISGAAAVAAQQIAALAIMSGFTADAFPGPENDILIALRRNNQYYEITASADSTISYFLEVDEAEIDSDENQPVETIISKLKEGDEFVWSTTASFIPVTGTQLKGDS